LPPEQPPYLVILDTSFGDDGLKGITLYVTPVSDRLRVRWGVGSTPRGYKKKGGGVVFVAGYSHSPPPPDKNVSIARHDGRYVYSEGLAGAPWLMLVMILPAGNILTEPIPAPDGAHLFGDRLAVYWRLSKSEGIPEFVQVKWGLRAAPRDLGEALRAIPPRAPLPFDAEEAPEFGVFLSYRRADDRWAAGRISDRLIGSFGARAVFRDVHSIKLGKDFRREIDAAVGRCKVMLVLVGPSWLDPPKKIGKRRIDSKADWVRIEIEAALQRHRLIVPLLLDEARMPDAGLLPESLRELAFRQGKTLHESTFDADLKSVIEDLREYLRKTTA
jgi:hypothetical protein